MRKVTRHDTVSWVPPEEERYVTLEDAAKTLESRDKGGANAARQRMLARRRRRLRRGRKATYD